MAYLKTRAAQETLVASGPWGPHEKEKGGLWLVRAKNDQAAQSLVDANPFYKAGLVADVQIRSWLPLAGP